MLLVTALQVPTLTLKTPPKAKGESDIDYESKLVSFLLDVFGTFSLLLIVMCFFSNNIHVSVYRQ